MTKGTLRVLLVNAKKLRSTDFMNNMDPYVILSYRNQKKKSSVAEGAGRNPEWNETFMFEASVEAKDLVLRIMDKDTFSTDDFVGEAIIPLDAVFSNGDVPTMAYNVVLPDKTYCGEIRVGLKFHVNETFLKDEEEDFGGYKQGYL